MELIAQQAIEKEHISVPSGPSGIEYIRVTNISGKAREERSRYEKALFDLIFEVSEPGQWRRDIRHLFGERSHYGANEWRAFKKGVPDKLAELQRAITGLVEAARKAGIEEGQNLLSQLASGELTFEAHDKEIARRLNR